MTVTWCVLRNDSGSILGAWVNHFTSDNPFCAEAEAVFQALKIAKDVLLEKVYLEGDATNVIAAL